MTKATYVLDDYFSLFGILCCFVLFCFVLFCFVLFCFVLFCFVLLCCVYGFFCFVTLFFAACRTQCEWETASMQHSLPPASLQYMPMHSSGPADSHRHAIDAHTYRDSPGPCVDSDQQQYHSAQAAGSSTHICIWMALQMLFCMLSAVHTPI